MLTIDQNYIITVDSQGLEELSAALDDAILAGLTPDYIPAWKEILETLQNYI